MGEGIAYVAAGDELPADLELLDRHGEFSVTAVEVSGQEITRPLPEDTVSIVVDHDPPAIDGLAVATWLQDRYAQLPLLLYPTQPSEALAAAALNLGFDAYVPPTDGGSVNALTSHLERLSGRSIAAGTIGTERRPPDRGDLDDASTADGSASPALSEDTMFEALLTSLPRWVSIYVKDRLGRHVAVSGSDVAFDDDARINTPDGKVLHSREDIQGKTDFDLYPPELAEETRSQEQRIMRTEEADVNVTEEVHDPTDETHYYSTTKAPWYDDSGTVAGIVGITVDITDRIQQKRAIERQNERLDRFAGVLSHDLRNPLAVATGQVELLDALDDLPEEADDSIDDLEWALDRIDALIGDTLDLARQGAIVDDPEATDLETIATDAWRSVDAGQHALDCDRDLPTISADPDRLQELLENLFRNAIEHGAADDEPLEIGVVATDEGFAVVDDGTGIPEEDRQTVFDEGFTTDDEGTGFGLAIVREIAEAHGWTVDVEASEEGGARFAFGDVDVVE